MDTRSGTAREAKHVRKRKWVIASVDYLQRDGPESKSPETPPYWRRKAPRVGKMVERQDSPTRGVRKRNEICIHSSLLCVRFAMIICLREIETKPSAGIGRPFSDSELA